MRNDVLVEIIEYYPEKKERAPKFMGTMHAYIEIGPVKFDMRGIRVYKNGKNFKVFPPNFSALDQGEKVRYPLLSLVDAKLNKSMKDQIIMKGRQYMRENIRV